VVAFGCFHQKRIPNFDTVKLTAYILIFSLFFASVGVSLLFFPELQRIRTVMRLKLEENNEDVGNAEFIFTKEAFAQLQWTKKDKEFLYKGKMYDVASVKKEGNRMRVFCFFDKDETGLRQKLKAFFSVSHDKNLPLQTTAKVLSLKYVAYAVIPFNLFNNSLPLIPKPYSFSLSVFENEISDPPPKA
jgi:hypothetical protein